MFPTCAEQVSDKQMSEYASLIYDKTGIRLASAKKMLLANRLRRRLRETGIADFDAYYQHLKRLRSNDPEWDAFLQEITTHETYLFRDETQWRWFREGFLPKWVDSARSGKGPRQLRVWSAAASTGDEAHTAACCAADSLAGQANLKVKIIGTDIGTGALEQARAGRFGERAMRLVPEGYRRRFFTKVVGTELCQATPAITGLIEFRQHNLMEKLSEQPFDVVFLKNVLIYFDGTSKKRVLDCVLPLVRPGGYLLTSAAEGVGDLLKGMKRVQPWLFEQKA